MSMKSLIALTLSCFFCSVSGLASGSEANTSAAEESGDRSPDSGDAAPASASDSAVRGRELIVNGFRAPSMGLEYRVGRLSIHAGAYPTVINEGEALSETTAWFAKAGMSVWFLPVHVLGNERSAFYAGASYLNDFGRDGWGHTAQVEAGFRFVVYEGFFLRLGASALYSPGRSCATDDCETVKVRPNPGLGWALALD